MSWIRRTDSDGSQDGRSAEHREPMLGPASESAPAHDHIGVLLRECREHFGEELRAVAQTLKIRHAYLQAIEHGHFEALPGPTYAVGFVRAYSDYLGLDTKVVLRRFRTETSGISSRSELDFPVAPVEGKFPNAATMVASLALVVAAVVGWQYFSRLDTPTAIVAAVVPASEAELAGPAPDAVQPVDAAAVAEAPVDADVPPEPLAVPAPRVVDAIVPPPPGDDIGAPAADLAEVAPLPIEEFSVRTEALDRDDLLVAAGEPVKRPVAIPIGSPLDVLDAPPAPGLAQRAAVSLPPAAPEEATPDEAAAVEVAALEAAQSQAAPIDEAVDEAMLAPLPPDPIAEVAPRAIELAAPAGTPEPAADTLELAFVEPDAGRALEAPDLPETELPLPPTKTAFASGKPLAEPESPKGRVYGMPNRDARIIIGADTDSWVQIRDQSQSDIFTRLLRAGDQYRVPNRTGLILLTGNAGGLRLTIDGEAIPPIGEIGEIARDVPLVADDLKSGATAFN